MECRLSLPHLPQISPQAPDKGLLGSRARCPKPRARCPLRGQMGQSPPLPHLPPHTDSGWAPDTVSGEVRAEAQGRAPLPTGPPGPPSAQSPEGGRGQQQEPPGSKHPAPGHPRMLVPALPRPQLLLIRVLGPPTAPCNPQGHTWTCGGQAGGSEHEFPARPPPKNRCPERETQCTWSHPPFSGRGRY